MIISEILSNNYIFYDKKRIDKIINIMFLDKNDEYSSFLFDKNEIHVINKIIEFLSCYNGNNLFEDLKSFILNHGKYNVKFYIYFIFLYQEYYGDIHFCHGKFLDNLYDVFYNNDIEYYYNKKKFSVHFSHNKYDYCDDINKSIYDYIDKNLSSDLNTELEKAVGIYLLLCKAFNYDRKYIFYETKSDIIPYTDITLENNEITCVQFSVIYYKLLKKYGIKASLEGNERTHMYVNICYGTMMISVDPTKFGCYLNRYELSDLLNVKNNYLINGFTIDSNFYADLNYPKYNKKRLKNIILDVYKKMNFDVVHLIDMDEWLHENVTFDREKKYFDSIDEIEERIKYLNLFTFKYDGSVESLQFFNKIVNELFPKSESVVKSIPVFKEVNERVFMAKLLVIYDLDNIAHYYFIKDGIYISYNLDELINLFNYEGLSFRKNVDLYKVDEIYKRLVLKNK